MRFKIGDRVVGKEGYPRIGGKVGTVVCSPPNKTINDYGIEFDEPVVGGHSLGDSSTYKHGHCRWAKESELHAYVGDRDNGPVPYFSYARVGDSVYDMALGVGIIKEIDLNSELPCKVVFDEAADTLYWCFTLGGSCEPGRHQTLFYSKPIFELPPPPKRKVRKVIEGYINIYPARTSGLYSTKAEADKGAEPFSNRLGEAVFIHHEYEE